MRQLEFVVALADPICIVAASGCRLSSSSLPERTGVSGWADSGARSQSGQIVKMIAQRLEQYCAMLVVTYDNQTLDVVDQIRQTKDGKLKMA